LVGWAKCPLEAEAAAVRKTGDDEELPAPIDLIIMPCVAMDSECARLGHGGGFYGENGSDQVNGATRVQRIC